MKTVIVTGANRGLGFCLVENLFQQNYRIILACRNLGLGNQAKFDLESKYPNSISELIFERLDLSDKISISDFVQIFALKYGKLDILINNAGILLLDKGDMSKDAKSEVPIIIPESFDESTVIQTITTNFLCTVELTEKLIPLMNQNGKIISIASNQGTSHCIRSEFLKNKFESENLSKEEIIEFAQNYIDETKNGTFIEKGWTTYAYGTSKFLIKKYMKVLAKNEEIIYKGIQVYSTTPGWIKTDMGGNNAPKTVEEGIQSTLYLLNLPFEVNMLLQGNYFNSDCTIIQNY